MEYGDLNRNNGGVWAFSKRRAQCIYPIACDRHCGSLHRLNPIEFALGYALSWWVIGLLIVLTLVEFFADKVPAVNHVNDVIQTIVRPVAGAIVFAASAKVITDIHPVFALAAGLVVAGGVHAVKAAAVRPAVTATTGGAGNVPVSIAEDVVATITSILAVVVPIILTVIIIMFAAWLIWYFWRRANRPRYGQTG